MSELLDDDVKLWWHLFVRSEPALEANVTTVFGESSKPPDEVAEIGLGFDNPHYYVESFDHDPDDDEKDAAILSKLIDLCANLRNNGPERNEDE